MFSYENKTQLQKFCRVADWACSKKQLTCMPTRDAKLRIRGITNGALLSLSCLAFSIVCALLCSVFRVFTASYNTVVYVKTMVKLP